MKKDKYSLLEKRIDRLESEVFKKTMLNNNKVKKAIKTKNLDFSINIRAFVKQYAPKKSGGKKFVLILAFLTKGEVKKDIKLTDITKRWNKMSAKNLLGCKFNNFYPNDAKTKGWVDSKKYGAYCLTDSWKEIL